MGRAQGLVDARLFGRPLRLCEDQTARASTTRDRPKSDGRGVRGAYRKQNGLGRFTRGRSNSLKRLRLNGRGERIRTSGLLVPNQALYQAEPRPEPFYSSGSVGQVATSMQSGRAGEGSGCSQGQRAAQWDIFEIAHREALRSYGSHAIGSGCSERLDSAQRHRLRAVNLEGGPKPMDGAPFRRAEAIRRPVQETVGI